MTPDERLQLIEDIKTSTRKREEIIRQAEPDQRFDIAAAWEDLDELDASIALRIGKARTNEN